MTSRIHSLMMAQMIALKENKSIFIAGCNCHLVHLAAGQGGGGGGRGVRQYFRI